MSYDIVCASWGATEFINEIKNILESINKKYQK